MMVMMTMAKMMKMMKMAPGKARLSAGVRMVRMKMELTMKIIIMMPNWLLPQVRQGKIVCGDEDGDGGEDDDHYHDAKLAFYPN